MVDEKGGEGGLDPDGKREGESKARSTVSLLSLLSTGSM